MVLPFVWSKWAARVAFGGERDSSLLVRFQGPPVWYRASLLRVLPASNIHISHSSRRGTKLEQKRDTTYVTRPNSNLSSRPGPSHAKLTSFSTRKHTHKHTRKASLGQFICLRQEKSGRSGELSRRRSPAVSKGLQQVCLQNLHHCCCQRATLYVQMVWFCSRPSSLSHPNYRQLPGLHRRSREDH